MGLTVLHCNGSTLDKKTLTVQNGAVTGAFSSLSPYGVGKPATDTSPKTGDDMNTNLWVAIMLVAGVSAMCMLLYRKQKTREE
ncbi:LPXTG cell wall anchor domain-containing protein [Eubacteriales bacterium OttesenSCG-928-M02]|nr:LPXTG cell wall anchor domain-containing protein [Eubacteriales bacterium OttesenSCG-928-M02]